MLILIKTDDEKNNLECTFKLTDTEDLGFEVFFERKNFREVLFGRGFSPHRVGYVLKMMNIRFPLERSVITRFLSEYKEDELVEYLRSKGFRVYKELDIGLCRAIDVLERRGYVVEKDGMSNDFIPRSKN